MRLIISFILLTGCAAERELLKEDPVPVMGTIATFLVTIGGLTK